MPLVLFETPRRRRMTKNFWKEYNKYFSLYWSFFNEDFVSAAIMRIFQIPSNLLYAHQNRVQNVVESFYGRPQGRKIFSITTMG